jgi:DNA polymerase-3 subunit alpha
MGIQVLGPDVNESSLQFSVNKAGQIRFGLGAVKGVGENAVDAIVTERSGERGPITSAFDLVRRVNLRSANQKGVGEPGLRWCIR